MRSLYRGQTSRDRAVKSAQITQLVQTQRRKNAAVSTHDAIRDFEKHLRTFQERSTAYVDPDDLPLNATAATVLPERTLEVTIPDYASDSSDSPRAGHANKMMRKSTSDSHIAHHSRDKPTMLDDTDDHLHARRPPSPLAFYDYGNINLKPRSVLTQQQKPEGSRPKSAGGTRSARRASSTAGFYFPGPDYKQGPYGFSMQDPILMPPRCWETGRVPDKSNQRSNNQRPKHHKGAGNDRGMQQAFGSKPTVPTGIRTTRGQDLKLERVFQNLDNAREEAGFEQTRYEEGNFEGRWCHPVVCKRSNYIHEGPVPHPAEGWMEQDLENSSPAELLAHRILSGINRELQVRHSTLPRLFNAVNVGTPGVLELEEFMDGLVRARILDGDAGITEKLFSQAMSFIDPDFDGRVNYPALKRGISAAQGVVRSQQQARAAEGHQVKAAALGTSYGSELPIAVVTVDKNSKSVFDFHRSMGMFRKQQAALLSQHGERYDAEAIAA